MGGLYEASKSREIYGGVRLVSETAGKKEWWLHTPGVVLAARARAEGRRGEEG